MENSSAHDRNLRTRPRDYSKQTLYAYLSALLVPASAYLMAQRVRHIICEEFRELLARVQILVLPTVPFTVPTIEECNAGWLNIDGKKIRPPPDERGGAPDSLCANPFNVTGLPAIKSIPCGFAEAGIPSACNSPPARSKKNLFCVLPMPTSRQPIGTGENQKLGEQW